MLERQNKMVLYESKFSKMYENHQKKKLEKLNNMNKTANDLHTLIEKNKGMFLNTYYYI